MSDVYHDPVGDRLRAHDLEMRRVRWSNAKEVLIALIVGLTVVAVAAAFVYLLNGNKPAYATGINANGRPWCETYDARPCPIFRPESVPAQPAQPSFTLTWPEEAKR